MRQTIIVVAALITSACASTRPPQAAPAPRVATHGDSLRNFRERLTDSSLIKALRADDLDSLAKELKATQRKRG